MPAIGDIVGCWVSATTIPTRVKEFFTEYEEKWLGVVAEPMELPPKLERLVYGHNIERRLQDEGAKVLLDAADTPPPFYQYGLECQQAPEGPNVWYSQFGLTARNEFAVIAAAVLGGKKWKDELYYTAWCNGAWHSTPYPELMSQLQTVRNTAGKEFVEAIAATHATFIKDLQSCLK